MKHFKLRITSFELAILSVTFQKLPKVNKQLAEKLLDDPNKETVRKCFGHIVKSYVYAYCDVQTDNPLGDDRFKALFTNPDFQIDEESEVRKSFLLLHSFCCNLLVGVQVFKSSFG